MARALGLTGGIGSGKSTVATMLAAHGMRVIDADAISRQTTAAGGLAIAAIRAQFGDAFINSSGALDRDQMRALVFSQPAARQELEAIIHPLVARETLRQLAAATTTSTAVLDHPLLVESGAWRAQLEAIIVVDCDVQTQIARTMQRSGLGQGDVERIIATQASRAQRLACADAVIFNEGISLVVLQAQVDAIAARFRL